VNPVEVIIRKRHGLELEANEIREFVHSYVNGKIPDYQMSSLLMAIYFMGLSDEEIHGFVNAYVESGEKVDLSFHPLSKIDKHSTGGVGDKTSIILAPLLASLDVVVPMISGRGLGHTGGTLDKLESIPGFRVDLSIDEFKSCLHKHNVCMIGQTSTLTPADKMIYALRDVTGTVENAGLITASILSKKIAEGAQGVVYDVKTGSGSTIKEIDEAGELAKKLLKVSAEFGHKSIAILTDMSSPLGYAIGNWLEIEECVRIMKDYPNYDHRSSDLVELTLVLGGAMLMLAGKCQSIDDGKLKCMENLANKKCYGKFVQLVEHQGGDKSFIENPDYYPKAKYVHRIKAMKDVYIKNLDAKNFGLAAVELGCGRMQVDDKIDNTAGIIIEKKDGEIIKSGETLCSLHANDETRIEKAAHLIRKAIEVSSEQPILKNKILEIID